MSITDFQDTVWQYYHENSRELPWRLPESDGTFDAYRIWISELMLQQTQVQRVIPKYEEFLAAFPTVQSLAAAELGHVLQVWVGLGYNRRAKFLWEAARVLVTRDDGQLPATTKELVALPGIGPNTAAAILVYAYNQPHVFIETNIRSVFIHHFLNDADQIDDKELSPFILESLDHEHPREWYWALMDYGSYLKKTSGNAARASKHYAKQSRFEGSDRQIRGYIIRELANGPKLLNELEAGADDPRLAQILDSLVAERLIRYQHGNYSL